MSATICAGSTPSATCCATARTKTIRGATASACGTLGCAGNLWRGPTEASRFAYPLAGDRGTMQVPCPEPAMDTQHPDLHPLYAAHVATLKARTDEALAREGFDHLVIGAGQAPYQFLDDRPYPFAVNPHFKHWLPVTKAPGSWIVYTPGKRPKLVYLQPHDYWHVVPDEPAGYWVEHFDVVIIREAKDARAHLPNDAARSAIVAETGLDGYAPNNPQGVLDYLHWQRSYKTPYELAMMRVASKIGARAHRAAERAFRDGASEFDIHVAYRARARQSDNDLPYSNIIALDEHCAVLH
jgi:Xaa-Pro dipeptidase